MLSIRTVPATFAAIVVSVVLLVTGCGGSSPQAGDLIQESNSHLSKAAAEVKDLGEFNTQWAALVSGKADSQAAGQVKELLEQARQRERKALAEVQAATESIAKIKDLKVSGEMRTWAGMKLAALEEQEKFLESELKAMDLRLQAIDSFLAGSSVESILVSEKQISVLEKESLEHAKRASELHKEANAYFKEKKLGG